MINTSNNQLLMNLIMNNIKIIIYKNLYFQIQITKTHIMKLINLILKMMINKKINN